MELKRDEIIKALEWCSELRLCVDCPMRAEGYFSHSGNACRKALMEYALSLINELTEENERLINECGNQSILWRQHFNSLYETAKYTLKADTVREMQTEIEARCIKGGIYPAFVKRTIDRIAEEMIGGNNGNKED